MSNLTNKDQTIPNLKQRKFGIIRVENRSIYWIEQRIDENGRGVVMRWRENTGLEEITPQDVSVRSRVHEYGGGDFCVFEEEVYFVNAADQQIYQCKKGVAPVRITNAPDHRFADLEYNPGQKNLIAVAEQHRPETPDDPHPLPKNMLVSISLSGEALGSIRVLDEAQDFYAAPRLSPDHQTLAYLVWDLPAMPWQSASLILSPLAADHFAPRVIAGGPPHGQKGETACFGPIWRGDGRLFFISDESGRGQLYAHDPGDQAHEQQITPLPHQDSGTDNLRPLWVFGMESIAITEEGEIYLAGFNKGELSLQHITEGQISKITSKARSVEYLKAYGNQLVAIVSTDESPDAVTLIHPDTGELTCLRSATNAPIDGLKLSKGRVIEMKTGNGPVYGLYYPPVNTAPPSDDKPALPPAIITIHGGPTAMVARGLNANIHQWTSLGYAVFEVDYTGSSGYGKQFRQALDGAWGSADVEDIIEAAQHLIREKLADPEKLIIEGGSSGGYTALMALAKTDLFKCAACNYPVTDLAQLLDITHKFEAGYIYTLTGTSETNAKQKLSEQSVLAHLDRITTPVIFFQGLDDKVVPPVQPRRVYEALKQNGVKTELVEFAGVGHGFRRADTTKTVLSQKIRFYNEVLKQ